MTLTNKELNKYFGQNFLGAVLELDPDLSEALMPEVTPPQEEEVHDDPMMTSTAGRFLHHLSSPMVHPHFMPVIIPDTHNLPNLYSSFSTLARRRKYSFVHLIGSARKNPMPLMSHT